MSYAQLQVGQRSSRQVCSGDEADRLSDDDANYGSDAQPHRQWWFKLAAVVALAGALLLFALDAKLDTGAATSIGNHEDPANRDAVENARTSGSNWPPSDIGAIAPVTTAMRGADAKPAPPAADEALQHKADALPLPLCSCRGHKGKDDAYKTGARPDKLELCASPWGGPVQYCSPVPSSGKCPPSQMKCRQADPGRDDADAQGVVTGAPCLCGFDIDRTLTAKQGTGYGRCPNASSVHHAFDSAFGGGMLTLSEAATIGIAQTQCRACYVSVVSQGPASGTTAINRARIIQALTTPVFAEFVKKHPETLTWDYGGFGRSGQKPAHSPFIVRQPNHLKQWAVEGVLEWYASKGVVIPRSSVFFFDDRGDNALYFGGTGMNARQISCGSREAGTKSYLGFCGALTREIVLKRGVFDCHHLKTPVHREVLELPDESAGLADVVDGSPMMPPPKWAEAHEVADDLDDENQFQAEDVDIFPSDSDSTPAESGDVELPSARDGKDHYDDMPSPEQLALPPCGCRSRRGATNAYKAGADPMQPVLCQVPWGGAEQICYPVPATGRCSAAQVKCNATLPAPVDAPPVVEPPVVEPPVDMEPCLCAFDIDRTLTSKQGSQWMGKRCPNVAAVPGSYDSAYGGGQLTLSAAGSAGIKETACNVCYTGVVSHGPAAGTTSLNRKRFIKAISTPPFEAFAANNSDAYKWSYGGFGRSGQRGIRSPLVVRQPDRLKQWAVAAIVKWYASRGVNIPWSRVFFFDDRADNVVHFSGTGMNAHQIACAARDGRGIGFCGATLDEIRLKPGVSACGQGGGHAR
mmetsp:Transcript_17603/g.48300  ORF Transcript_17603/g.48300 Transcript_17603/m.48300 type:complete len:807 (-) Transcript_17603:133-2553(-)|eukprot:CAMPEP_0117479414 /NCGR_PEP_ID=MMETSP0784-20121206/11871_1 /TAXON_ID=39447 /ORGANISM="" /LENGTH=806 /DNA_ID=CAMNT_0005273837 /DNA_START=23 /DNA_END=2443 /DNA_ORIENTATION=+